MISNIKSCDKCPICGSNRFTPLFQVPFPNFSSTKIGQGGFPLDKTVDVPTWVIVKCEDCSVRYPNPFPTKKEISDYYALKVEPIDCEIEHYIEVPLEERLQRDRLVEQLEILNGLPGSLLEIGPAAGWLLWAAKNRGWKVYGVEASPKFHKYAAGVLKLPVMLGTLEKMDLEGDNKYDVVVMMDVIEHLYDPIFDLKKVRKIISDKGFLVITTGDMDSGCARFYGLNWRHIIISHVFYWTKPPMFHALQRAGFRVERFSEPRYWHPNPCLEYLYHIREIGKFIARILLRVSYVPLSRLFPSIRHAVAAVTRGRLSHKKLMYRIGDQPVLGDVMFVVARPL